MSPTPMRHLHDELGERVSSAVHLVAFLLAIVLLAYAIELVPAHQATRPMLVVFASVMVLMYLASAMFHAAAPGTLREALERLDRATIYLFIAASYSLFLRHGHQGFSAAIWTLAIAGAAISLMAPARQSIGTALPYLLFGWLAVSGIAWQAASMSAVSLVLLVTGALVYTLGIRYYLRPGHHRFAHALWHLFVALGSAIHTASAFV